MKIKIRTRVQFRDSLYVGARNERITVKLIEELKELTSQQNKNAQKMRIKHDLVYNNDLNQDLRLKRATKEPDI